MASHGSILDVVRSAPANDDLGRQAVVDAALAAFLDFGIRRTTMTEIATRTGISPATLYRRFPQKRDVVTAVVLREAARFLDEVDTAVDHDASAPEQSAALFVAVITRVRRHPLLTRLIRTEPDFVLPALTVDAAPTLALGTQYLTAFIGRLQVEGKLADYDPLPRAEFLARLVISLVLTPETCVPAADADLHAFALEHIVPLTR